MTEDEDRRRNYRDYLYEAIGKESRDSLADSVASTILGIDDFVRDIRKKYLEGEEERQQGTGGRAQEVGRKPEIIKSVGLTVCRNGCLSIGFKSRERSCPYTFPVPGSSVRVTGGCKFPWGKVAGRSASEPMCSLVNWKEMPIPWSEGEGRRRWDGKTEASDRISRGSRGGMQRKIGSAVREIHYGGGARGANRSV